MKPARLIFPALGACWCVYGSLKCLGMIPAVRLGELMGQIRGHFAAHSWNWPGLFAAMGGHILTLAAVAAGIWVCWRAGLGMLAWLRFKAKGPAKGALTLALGLGTFSLALQGLGLTGLWFPALFAVLAAGLASGTRGRLLPGRKLPTCDSKALPYLVAFSLAVAFAGARTPRTAAAVDAMTYHFAAPEHFLSLHKIVAAPWQPQWHLPLLTEMLYAPAFAAAGTEAAKSVDFLMLLACLAGLFWLCGAFARAAAGWWAAALFAGAGQACFSLWQGKNDLAGAFFVLAASGCVLRAIGGKGAAYWLVAGICGGWAYAGKPIHSLPVAAGLAGAALLLPAAIAARGLLLALVGSALAAGTWALQNILFTGDPIYPHGFGLAGMDAPWWPLNAAGAVRVKLAAWHLTPAVWPEVAAGLGWAAWLPVGSLALGCLAPWAFMGRDRAAYWLKGVVLLSGAAALAGTGTPRYLLPQAGLLCAMAALGMRSSGAPSALRAGLLGFSLLTTFAVICAGSGAAGFAALRLSGQLSREQYQLESLTSFELMKGPLGGCVPAGKQALFVGEARRLEMPCRVMAPSTYAASPAWRLSRESFSAAEIRKKFRQLNVACLVYNCVSATFHSERLYPGPVWSEGQLGIYREFFSSYAELAAEPALIDRQNGGFYIWSLASRPHAPRPLMPALPGSEGELARTIVMEKGRLDSAWSDLTLARLVQIRKRFEGIGSYHALVAFLSRILGDADRAVREYEKSVKCGYFSENNLPELIGLHVKALRLERARVLLEEAAAIYPEESLRNIRTAYHMTRAYVAGINRKRFEAIRELEAATAWEPNSPDLLAGIAEAYRRLGMLFKARSVIGRALELDPADARAAALLEAIDGQISRSSASGRPDQE